MYVNKNILLRIKSFDPARKNFNSFFYLFMYSVENGQT